MSMESNLPPIYPTSELAPIDNNNESGEIDQSLMQSFRDEVLSSFDPISPKIIEIERTFAKSIPQSRNQNNANFSDQIKDYQMQIKDLHSKSIEASRRVQSLTLSAQTSSALAIPRLLRPVNENFCIFKSEFDETLKNLALLSGRINQKTQYLSSCLDTYKKSPQNFGNAPLEIEQLNTKTIENEKFINSTIETASKLIEEAETEISRQIDQEMQKADETLKELEESAEKGHNDAASLSQQMITDRESIQQSIIGLSANIEKVITEKLNGLNESIENANKRSTAMIETIQNNLSDEFDQLLKNESLEVDSTMMNQIESSQEETQLLTLLNKLEDLQNQIRNLEAQEKSPIEKTDVQNEIQETTIQTKTEQGEIEIIDKANNEEPNQNIDQEEKQADNEENEEQTDNEENEKQADREENEKQGENEELGQINQEEKQIDNDEENEKQADNKDEINLNGNAEEEVFEKILNGESIRFYCNNLDGTFHF